jgi:hypothetical protein
MGAQQEKPYHIAAIDDLQADYSPDHLRFALGECRKVIGLTIAEDNRSPQQVARVRILRYLDLQLSRAIAWAAREADLMAIVLRSQIELWAWAKFVAKGVTEAQQFLDETIIDAQELNDKMNRAFPGRIQPLPAVNFGNRISLKRANDDEEYDFKLCSKLIHPSSLMLNHPELTIDNNDHKAYLAVQVLLYAWLIVTTFHDLNWMACGGGRVSVPNHPGGQRFEAWRRRPLHSGERGSSR